MKALAWGLALPCILLLGLFALRGASPDLAALLPAGDRTLTREADFFAQSSGMRVLLVEFQGSTAAIQAAATDVVQALEPLGAHPQSLDPDGVARATDLAYCHLDVLLTPEDLDGLAAQLEPDRLAQRLTALRERASRPEDTLTPVLLRRDPLGLAGLPLAVLGQGRQPLGHALLHEDGRHALLTLVVDFPPEAVARASALVDTLQNRLRHHTEVETSWSGPYRNYVENARTVWDDLLSTGPLGVLLVALCLWSLLGRWRTMAAVHLPAVMALAGGLAAAGLWSTATGRPMPLALIAFAAGMLGIAVDYGTHVAIGHAHGHRPDRELVTTYLTTTGAFVVLLTSSTPAIQCLGAMVIGGLSGGLAASLTLLPPLLPPADGRDRWHRISRPLLAWAQAHGRRHLLIAALITAATLPGLASLAFESDLRRYDGSSAAAWKALEGVQERWGGTSGTLLVAQGDGLPACMERLRSACQRLSMPLGAVERLLPDAAEQARRRSAWNAFWSSRPPCRDLLTQAAVRAGIRPAALEQAMRRYAPVPVNHPELEPSAWSGTPVQRLIDSQVHQAADHSWTVAVPLPVNGREDLPRLQALLGDDSSAWLANRGALGQRVVYLLTQDLLQRSLLIAIAITLVVWAMERSWRRTAAILLPVIAALGWTFGLLGLTGHPITPFSLLAAAFLCGIGIDSAVFLASCSTPGKLSPILNASVTTIVGMGALIGADHPVIRSLGLTLTIGMAAVLVSTLLITPFLSQRNTP